MNKRGNFFEEIVKQLGDTNPSFNILENKVDIELQTEYFDFISKNKKLKSEDVEQDIEILFTESTEIEELKTTLVKLAAIDDVRAFRAIEKFSKNKEHELSDWAILALHESRMLVESSLTNGNTVFISTGMGGLGNKLRYFCVFPANTGLNLSDFHNSIIKKELQFSFGKNESELEEIEFFDTFITFICLIPITVSLQSVFNKIIEDCNQFGEFLSYEFIVSNVKKMAEQEIRTFLETGTGLPGEDMDEIVFENE